MLNGIAREYAIGRRRCPNGISLNRMPRRIHIERAVLFCSIAPDLVVYVLRSTLSVNSHSHDRGVGRSTNELVGVLTRPVVAIVRNGWERVFAAPLVVVAHRIGRFIFAFRAHAGNCRTDISVHKCFPAGNDSRRLRVITISSPDVPAPEQSGVVDAFIFVDSDVIVGYAFLGECCDDNISRDKILRSVKENIVAVEHQR